MNLFVSLDLGLGDTVRVNAVGGRPLLIFADDFVIAAGHSEAAEQAAIADKVLAAVTEWHAEIHRRDRPGPVDNPNQSREDNL